MKERKFKDGDLVRLKCGGPVMVVGGARYYFEKPGNYETGEYHCTCYDSSESRDYPECVLEAVDKTGALR